MHHHLSFQKKNKKEHEYGEPEAEFSFQDKTEGKAGQAAMQRGLEASPPKGQAACSDPPAE